MDKQKRKLVRNLAMVFLAIFAAVVTWQGMHRAKTASPPLTPAPQTDQRNSAPKVPKKPSSTNSAPAIKASKSQPNKPPLQNKAPQMSQDAKDAVDAAVLADVNLTLAQFVTPAQRRVIVQATVMPALRARVEAANEYTGRVLAEAYGYQGNISEVQDYANLTITTRMTRVDQLSAGRVIISLFDYTHFQTRSDLEMGTWHRDLSITVIVMKRVGSSWLIADTYPGPEPQFGKNQVVSFNQKLAAYQPYLRRFTEYERSP